REAHRIAERNIAHALFHDCLDYFEDEVMLGAGRVFERKVDVWRILPPTGHRRPRQLQHLRPRLAKLHLTVEWRCADERVDRAMLGVFDGLPCAVDVVRKRARNRANLGVVDVARNQPDRLELGLAGDGEAAIECIEPHVRERTRDLQLLLGEVVDARRLLAITQSGLKKFDDAWHTKNLPRSSTSPLTPPLAGEGELPHHS